MEKHDVAKAVASGIPGLTIEIAHKAIDAYHALIKTEIKNGNDFMIQGIGGFKIENKAARAGRNPLTGAAIQIPARRAVKFKVSKTFADAIK